MTEHLKRLNFIRRARALGFSIGEVRTLLRLADERKRPCVEVRVVAEAHRYISRVRDTPGFWACASGCRESYIRTFAWMAAAVPRLPALFAQLKQAQW